MTDRTKTPANPPERTVAQTHRNPWPGWIWAIPLAAVAIVAWLVARELSARGVSVTVTFENAAQMKADTTKVIYRGIMVGKVNKVSLAADGSKAVVELRIQDEDKSYLRSGTRFYLEGATLSLSDPASLKAIFAGPTIEMLPGGGKPARSFVGIVGEAPTPLAVEVPYRINFNGAVGALRSVR
jgi:paraquat-inducible protein B